MKTSTLLGKARTRQTALRPQVQGDRHTPSQISRILVPIDFSKHSLQTIELALPLVKKFGAQLDLVHVFAPDYPIASMVAMPLIVPELAVGRVQRHWKDMATKYSVRLGHENIHALRGRPSEEICHLAREHAIDLIVMSTRGNTGFKHLALGSTAEHVVRHSPCPVLVMHPVNCKENGNRKMAKPKLNFKKILVPIDFSECSLKGLAYAKALAKRFGSELILLNSIALQYYITSDEYARYDLPQLIKRTEKCARDQMRDLIEKTDWEGIQVTPSLQMGHAGQQICGQAVNLGVDVVVTSTHGTTGFKHVLVGSTAEYTVRHASCPVLVVPSHERSFSR